MMADPIYGATYLRKLSAPVSVAALPQLLGARVNILHQTGAADETRIREAYARARTALYG